MATASWERSCYYEAKSNRQSAFEGTVFRRIARPAGQGPEPGAGNRAKGALDILGTTGVRQYMPDGHIQGRKQRVVADGPVQAGVRIQPFPQGRIVTFEPQGAAIQTISGQECRNIPPLLRS